MCIFLIEFHVVFFFTLLLISVFSIARSVFCRFSSESISQQVALETCSPTALLITVFKVSSQSINDELHCLCVLFVSSLLSIVRWIFFFISLLLIAHTRKQKHTLDLFFIFFINIHFQYIWCTQKKCLMFHGRKVSFSKSIR